MNGLRLSIDYDATVHPLWNEGYCIEHSNITLTIASRTRNALPVMLDE